ncbi:hypothetical protein G6F56_010884 [Rhizopus delemar]|nr:hypothetical protein G6F56_010884 [Rhizopus delemar]
MTLHTTSASIASSKGKKPYKSWLKDGVNGGPSSMEVLVNWLSKKTNYAKWKGDDCERIPKKSLLESIIDEMREVGIYHRLAKDVASKISTLQANYRLARGWKEIEGKKLVEAGATEDVVNEELLKRFPYWDSLNEVFSSNKSAAWPMAIRNITHTDEDGLFDVKQEDLYTSDQEQQLQDSGILKRRRLSDSLVQSLNISATASPTNSTQSLPTIATTNTPNDISTPPVLVIRPLPRVLPPATHYFDSHHYHTNSSTPHPSTPRSTLADSLLQVTREKESGRMRRSQEMLHFLKEKRIERDQLLVEREITKRVKAKAELVKNLMDAGFSKEAIEEQLNKL